MIKFLPTINNTPWTIKKNAQSPNEFNKVMNFPNAIIREEFINNELFAGKNYKELVGEASELNYKSYNIIDSINAIFRIDKIEINRIFGTNSSTFDLLNKDYAVVNDNGKYLFYQITGSTENGNLIEYSCELDPFFTYNIQFKNNQLLDRAHYDRFNLSGKFDFNENSIFNNPDELDDLYSSKIPKREIDINYEITLLGEFDKEINKRQWLVLYFSGEDDAGNDWVNGKFTTSIFATKKFSRLSSVITDTGDSIQLPVIILIAPIKSMQVKDTTTTEIYEWNANHLYNFYLNNENLISASIIETPPFLKGAGIPIIWKSDTELEVDFSNSKPAHNATYSDTYDGVIFGKDDANDQTLCFLSVQTDRYRLSTGLLDLEISPDITNMNEYSARDIDREIKLKCSPYHTFSLINGENKYEYQTNLFNEEIIRIDNYHSFTSETWKSETFIVSGVYSLITDIVGKGTGYSNKVIKQAVLPTQKDPWQEFTSQNKINQTSGLLTTILNPFKPFGGAKEIIRRQDIKTSPNSTNNTTDTLGGDFVYLPIDDILVEEELLDSDKKIVADFYYENGYASGRIENLNNFKANRYYFNFLQAKKTFLNFDVEIEDSGVFKKVDISADIKQMLSDSIESGVQFWHYRNKDTWQGLNNFDFENIEIKYISNERNKR